MPEVHVVGEIIGASDLKAKCMFCKWSLISSKPESWNEVEGTFKGQTHLSDIGNEEIVLWNHPLDCYYSVTSMQGWPKIKVEVWEEDGLGRHLLCGYGVTYIPTEPGQHYVECVIWKPEGSFTEKIYNYFLDTTSHLQHGEVVESSEDKFDLFTETVGSVHLNIDLIVRGFKNYGVEFKSQ